MKALPSTTLSREGRDTLWLLAILALSIAPHALRLPLWCTVGAIAAMAWRARVAWTDGALPPRIWLLVSLAVSLALTVGTFHSLFGREAGITLVTLLAALKTLELRARRDAFVITSLGFFLILTQFLYSQSLSMAALMSVVLMGLLTSLVLAQRPTGRPSIWSSFKVALRCVIMGMPLMVALFVLFPRLGPLWSVPADAGPHTGLSDHINLGNMADLAQDDSVAMRIRFLSAPPQSKDMYFRGPVLDVFDGRTWRSSLASASTNRTQPSVWSTRVEDESTPKRGEGEGVVYQITIEPSRITAVPLLDGTLLAAPTPPGNAPVMHRLGLNWLADAPLSERYQVDATAWPGVRHGPLQVEPALLNWLQLPRDANPRTLQWAAHFQAQEALRHADPRALSAALLQYIRKGGYSYTLTPEHDQPEPDGSPPANLIDRFWLDRKAGFCEHFATAYVVIMRAMGVPSRVITGYQGAEYNPVDGLFVVRNSDAHAWAEFWQPGEGWVRVDPTAAVAPERIERPRTGPHAVRGLSGPLAELDPALWTRLRDYSDAINHRWNVWVLQYSRNRQMDMLKSWGFASPSWLDLVRLCGGVLVVVSILGTGWLWWTRPKVRRSSWRKSLMRVHKALAQAGLPEPHNCPAPAPAMTWHQAIADIAVTTDLATTQQRLLAALSELDALRYAQHQGSRQAAKRSRQALIQRIEQLAQLWRATRRRDKAN